MSMSLEPEINMLIDKYMYNISKLSTRPINNDILFILSHMFKDIAAISYNVGKVHELNDFLILQARSPSNYNN